MSNQIDSAEFARQVLYHLSALAAEVRENKLLLTQVLSHLKNRPAAEFEKQWQDQLDQMTARLYTDSLEAAKIPPPDDPSPPQAPRAVRRG